MVPSSTLEVAATYGKKKLTNMVSQSHFRETPFSILPHCARSLAVASQALLDLGLFDAVAGSLDLAAAEQIGSKVQGYWRSPCQDLESNHHIRTLLVL